MHSVKQLNLRGLGGVSCKQITSLTVAGAPGHGLTHPPPTIVHKAQTLRSLREPSFLKYTFPCFLSCLLLPELHLHPLPSIPHTSPSSSGSFQSTTMILYRC